MTREAALVTGAGKRVGATLAQHFASKGMHVYVHVHQSIADGNAVVERIHASGGSAEVVSADLGDHDEVAAMMSKIAADETALTLVINNASFFAYDAPFHADADMLRKSLDSHVFGPYFIFECLRGALADHPIDIFNILDQKLENVNPDYYSYTIGKFALLGLTKLWAAAGVENLRVFGIMPGLMLTSGDQSEKNFQNSITANPLRRAFHPDDLPRTIDFCIANKSLPSQIFAVDGGESLMPRARDIAFDPSLHPDTEDPPAT